MSEIEGYNNVQNEAYTNFISSVDSEATKTNYRTVFPYFMKFCKREAYEQMLKIEIPKLEGLVRDYIIHLKQNKKLAPGSISMYISGIRHFYQMNDVGLNWEKIKKFKGRFRNVVEDKPYTREQIKTLVDGAASLRDKCIILLMASAGLRRGALPYLRIRDLQKIDKYQLYKIAVYKNEQEYYAAFCTPECAKYIDQYLDWRQRLGEKLHESTPLLRKSFDTVTEVNRPKPISHYIISTMITSLLDKTGVRVANEVNQRTELMQCHGFRKFFKTICINAGMNPLYSEYLMGHRSGLTKSYFKPSDAELLEGNDKALGYTAVINDLTINEEYRLRKKLEELTEKKDRIEIMQIKHKEEMKFLREEMENRFQQILTKIDISKIK